jgi:prophage antirepressor-like protein|uniref:Repressor domain protein n=1 Tax=Myoviridae sp. ctEg02 TaxID=2825061 RepID=A0A8S5PRA9_9CAUD|nr:MAG TPA: repressor domain protein [Myoviridae sp. ctEg02]
MENSPLALFEHEKFGSLRVIEHKGEPWFVARDVCAVLGTETRDLPDILEHDEQRPIVDIIHTLNDSTGLRRDSRIISEPGLYSLILRSRKPEAKAFKRWVTHEVIPSIRKTGGYLIAKLDDTPEVILARAVLVAQETIRRIEAERDDAIRTKAEIGSRREATAMATASAAVRKAAALENELGRGRDYKSVKGIPWFLDIFADTPAAYSVAGRKLSDMSRRMDYEIREIEDSRFGSVKAYHVDVIEAFRLSLKNDLNMLGKYRLRRAA